jgi:hypothetical protein
MQGYLFATALDHRCRHAIQQCVDSADHRAMLHLQSAENALRAHGASLTTLLKLLPEATPDGAPPAMFFSPSTPSTSPSPSQSSSSNDRGRWLAILSFIRVLGITYLRHLQSFHTQLQWCADYWKWARRHPRQNHWHLLWTHQWAWTSPVGASVGSLSALWFQRTREAGEHVLWLAVVDALVTENIGAVHSALQWLCKALRETAAENAADEDVRRMNPGVSTPFKANNNNGLFRSRELNASGSSVDCSSDFTMATMDSRLGGIATEALCRIVPRNPEKMPETTMNMILHLPSDLRTGGAPPAGGASAPQSSATFPHHNQDAAFPRMLHAGSFAVLDEAPTIPNVLRVLRKVSVIASDWTERLLATAATRHSPPAGRHWLRFLCSVAVVLPLSKFLITASLGDVRRVASTARAFATHFAGLYVVQPCRDLLGSLFAARVGSKEHAASLQRETESMARIVRDFHRDVDSELSKSDLERIYQQALLSNDMGILNRWFEDAIRHPILSFFFGSIVRLMLIQFEQQKLQLSRVLYQSDEVLQANDFNFKVMALSPVAAVLGLILWTVMARRQRHLRPVVRKLRMCWRNLHFLISHQKLPGVEGGSSSLVKDGGDAGGSGAFLQLQGGVLLYVHEMRLLIAALGRRECDMHDELLRDLDDIEDPDASQQQRLLALERIMLVHFTLFERQV